jgi:nucleoside-diphosphate-sugar epimerase
MKRVLVTGGTGFIGGHAWAPLRERGFEIHAVGRRPPGDGRVAFHEADLLDPGETEGAVAAVGATHLLHLAWYAEPGLFWSAPANLDWVGASLTLLRLFAEHGGRRAVFAGSCAEYSWGGERLDEQMPCRPATLYGVAKDATHRVAAAYAALAGVSLAWGRIFFLYGPGEKSGRLVSDAIAALLAGRNFPTSQGTQRRDFMHVADVAAAFAALADCDVRGPVNIGSGAAVPVRSLLEGIARELGGRGLLAFGARPMRPGEPSVIEANVARLRDEVGFRPSFDLPAGLSDTLRWWQGNIGTQ